MRSVRSRPAAVTGLLAIAIVALPTAAVAAVAPSDDVTPVVAVSLEPYFPGEPSWPSTAYPTWALRIDLSDADPVPGEATNIDLSANLTAAAAPGALRDEDGVELATFAVSPDGHRITVTYSAAAAAVVDLQAELAIFVSADSVGPGKDTLTAQAAADGLVFPLSASYTGLAWNPAGTVGTWVPSPTGSLRFLARSVVEAVPEFAEDGGQWIGVGGASDWTGRLAPVSGTTRVFGLDELPATLDGFTDPASLWQDGVDYTVDEQETHDGGPVFGVTVTGSPTGYIVVEQAYDLVSAGPSLFDAPNTALPLQGRKVFGAGTRIVTGSVGGHQGGGNGVGGLSTLAFFAGSGGAASGAPISPALSVDRAVTPDTAAPGETTGRVALTIANTGNTPLDVNVADLLAANDASVLLRDADASSGAVTVDGRAVRWTGIVGPGETLVVTYTFRATASGPRPGTVSWSGNARGVVPRNAEESVEPPVPTAEVTVSARPLVPEAPTSPGSGSTLATTGSDARAALGLGALAVLLGAGGAALLVSSRTRSRS
ncbi:hypothetical protein ACFY5A_14865 [Microbacterium sp. NPDC012755]|uniref:hypothetical protein n=1 Tax=Microbacterium sp. NPDC012755 TaxID=3364184 RepID=UPI003674C5C6